MIGPDDAPPLRPRPSAASAIRPAVDWTRWVLVTDGNAGKWFTLGFCAFLATLGQGAGGNFNFDMPGDQGGDPGGQNRERPEAPSIRPALEWITDNPELSILIGVGGFMLIALVTILVIWLSSRGKFMLFDGIVRNQGAVREPWRYFVHLGNSLCGFRLLLSFSMMFIGLAVLVVCGLIAWPDIQAEEFGRNASVALALGTTIMIPLSLIAMVVGLLLDDFIVPIMYLRNLRTLDAFSIFRAEIARGHVGTIVLYYLLKIVLAIMSFFIIIIGVLLTCCLAGCVMMIPYIGSVLLLPFSVFFRCYSIFFIEQFGPDWRFFPPHGEI